MDRFAQNVGATLQRTFRDSTEALVDPDGVTPNQTVPVTVYDSAGISYATATATRVSQGVYTFTLTPTQTSILDTYKVQWRPTFGTVQQTHTTYYAVVGGFYMSITDIRAFDTVLASPSTADIVRARRYAEEYIERVCGVAFVPRGRRVTLNGRGAIQVAFPDLYSGTRGSAQLPRGSSQVAIPDLYPRRIVAVSLVATDGTATAYTQSELADVVVEESGYLSRRTAVMFPVGTQNITVFYEHGLDEPPDAIRRAMLLLVKAGVAGEISGNVSQMSTEGYSISYRAGAMSSVPGVDELLAFYNFRVPALA